MEMDLRVEEGGEGMERRGKEWGCGGIEGLVGDEEEEEVWGWFLVKLEVLRWKMNDEEGNLFLLDVVRGGMIVLKVILLLLLLLEEWFGGGGVEEEELRDEERELSEWDLSDCWVDCGDGGLWGLVGE